MHSDGQTAGSGVGGPGAAGAGDWPGAAQAGHAADISAGPGWAEHGLSALNAWLGDWLAERRNPLGIELAFYHDNQPLELSAAGLLRACPHPTARLCVLVHGLGCNEAVWGMRHTEARFDGQTYGSLLQRELGYTPLYVRYNSGLPVSTNGAGLDRLLARLLAVYPVAVEELILIGYSMGGLVVRSACHAASLAPSAWLPLARRAFYIGSPHLGAPLEKAANVLGAVLDTANTTATHVLRDLLHLRSRGIKDLRFGNLTDQDWLDFDPDELLCNRRVPVPWPDSIRHYRIAGTLVRDAAHPVSRLLGDGMVRQRSAAGAGADAQPPGNAVDFRLCPGVHHLDLPRHPDVYEHLARWCKEPLSPLPEGASVHEQDAPASAAPAQGPGPGPGQAPASPAAATTPRSHGPEAGSPIQQPGQGLRRLRGLQQLAHDGFERGTRAIEAYQQHASDRVFDTLALFPGVRQPAQVVRTLYEGTTKGVYGSIRLVNRAVAGLGRAPAPESHQPPDR